LCYAEIKKANLGDLGVLCGVENEKRMAIPPSAKKIIVSPPPPNLGDLSALCGVKTRTC
jgi:hypothetical protein